MDEEPNILPYNHPSFEQSAESFAEIYEVTLVGVECYLEKVIQDAGPEYSAAYFTWYQTLHQLIDGINELTHKKPLSDPRAFSEAVEVFSFDGTIQLLNDLCISAKIQLENGWRKKFKEHVSMLLECTKSSGALKPA